MYEYDHYRLFEHKSESFLPTTFMKENLKLGRAEIAAVKSTFMLGVRIIENNVGIHFSDTAQIIL